MGELERISERRRAVALTQHYRYEEGLSTARIAQRLGRSPATIRAYLYDPDGSKASRVKESYRGECSRCGAPTSGSGPGRSRSVCSHCNGQASAKWDRPRIETALRCWRERYGKAASSTDLSAHYALARAPRDGGLRLRRLTEGFDGGRWPAKSVVEYHYGTVAQANRVALAAMQPWLGASVAPSLGIQSVCVPKPP